MKRLNIRWDLGCRIVIKTFLTGYCLDKYQALNSGGLTYTLFFEREYFFGIIKRKYQDKFLVPDHCNIKKFTDNWDELIKNRLALK